MTPKIAFLAASSRTQKALRSWVGDVGFDLGWSHDGRKIPDDKFDFHVTLLATKNAISAPETDHRIRAIEVQPDGFGVLGKHGEVPVMHVAAHDGLDLARQFFVQTYGAEPTFEEFRPHISLSYRWDDGEPALKDLDGPHFPLTFDRLIVSKFDAAQKALLLFPRRIGAHRIYA